MMTSERVFIHLDMIFPYSISATTLSLFSFVLLYMFTNVLILTQLIPTKLSKAFLHHDVYNKQISVYLLGRI